MKIISKYKDYYDYLQGVYGVDEKLVLDRRSENIKVSKHTGKHVLVICGKVLEFLCINGVFYFGKDIERFNESELLKKTFSLDKKPKYLVNPNINQKNYWNFCRFYYDGLSEDVYNIYNLKELSKECPIFLYHVSSETIWQRFPSLVELGVNKVIDAHTIWNELSNWLSNKITSSEPQQPVGDDKVRLLSAGFDLKTSFRH